MGGACKLGFARVVLLHRQVDELVQESRLAGHSLRAFSCDLSDRFCPQHSLIISAAYCMASSFGQVFWAVSIGQEINNHPASNSPSKSLPALSRGLEAKVAEEVATFGCNLFHLMHT